MWNVEQVLCNSLWAVWTVAMAKRPAERVAAWPVRRDAEMTAAQRLYPDRSMLPGW